MTVTPKIQTTKVKIDEWDYIHLKSFCIAKKIINRVKRHPTRWEETYVKIYIYIWEEINLQIHKDFYNSIGKKNNPVESELKAWIGVSPKRISKGATGIQKKIQHH